MVMDIDLYKYLLCLLEYHLKCMEEDHPDEPKTNHLGVLL